MQCAASSAVAAAEAAARRGAWRHGGHSAEFGCSEGGTNAETPPCFVPHAASRADTAARGYLSFSAQEYFMARWLEQPRPKTDLAIARAALALANETEHRFSHLNDLQCAAAISQPHTAASQCAHTALSAHWHSEHDSHPFP